MKFAHMADCHIGAWRDPKLRNLSTEAFSRAVNISIEKSVDFVLISGDLFHTALPGIDYVKEAVKKIKLLKDENIAVYIIPGSHDYSPSGKTMLDVLEEAGLVKNVVKGSRDEQGKLHLKFTTDPKTGAKITGLLGKRGGLEKSYYENLEIKELEKEPGTKIFMFHSAITELKPKSLEKMDSNPVSLLPKGFEYYAGGHVHIVKATNLEGYKNIVYPGPLFPDSFSELEELESGGFYIYDHGKIERIPVNIKNVHRIKIDVNHKTPEEAEHELMDEINKQEYLDTIVLLRIQGKLKGGKPSDIDFKKVFKTLYGRGAYYVMKNTSKLTTEEFEEIKISSSSVEEIEENIIKEHLGQVETSFSEREKELTRQVMKTLSSEQAEEEKKYEYETRLKEEMDEVLKV